MRRGRALRHPDRSAPRLGLRFAVGTGHLCQIKFWLMQHRFLAYQEDIKAFARELGGDVTFTRLFTNAQNFLEHRGRLEAMTKVAPYSWDNERLR